MKEIEERRSIRKFKGSKISDLVIETILNAGILSPSGKNKQPWQFVVIKNQELKAEIAKKLLEKSKNIEKNAIYIPTSEAIETSSFLILVFNELENNEVNLLSLGASIENMLLEATHQGLGSLWIHLTDIIEEEIKELVKTDLHLVSVVAIGKKEEQPNRRPRKSIEEKVKWIKERECNL